MLKVINKKGKKYLNIDGREYGPKSLYFHIQRTTSTLEYFTKSGDWDEDRQSQVKKYIQRLVEIYRKYYPEEDNWWFNISKYKFHSYLIYKN